MLPSGSTEQAPPASLSATVATPSAASRCPEWVSRLEPLLDADVDLGVHHDALDAAQVTQRQLAAQRGLDPPPGSGLLRGTPNGR